MALWVKRSRLLPYAIEVSTLFPFFGPPKNTWTADTQNLVGKTLAFTTITFTNEKGEIAARGSHTKFIAKVWGKHEPYTTDKPIHGEDE